jgi:hypothetical protein
MMVIALMAAMTFSSCEQDDSYDAETLVAGYWQGYLGVYYQNRWSVSGKSYATEMHFRHNGSYYTSGRGYEVDYDTRNPHVNYAYCTFKWFIVDGEITLIYDDDLWSPVYITEYSLSSSHFYGYIYTDFEKDSDGNTINNTRAMKIRAQMEADGVWDRVKRAIDNEVFKPSDFNLNNAVTGWDTEDFTYYYNKMLDGKYDGKIVKKSKR